MNLILTASTPLRYESDTCNTKDKERYRNVSLLVIKTVNIERSDPGDPAV